MAVYLVPLMVGTRNIAFPRLNAFSYWIYLAGGILLWVAFALDMGPDVGWFAYVPLSGPQYGAGKRADIWAQMITFTEISALAVAVEIVVTVLQAARAGHVARPHAAVRLGDAGHVVPGHHGDAGDHGGQHVADPRPAGRHAFLQSGRRRRRAAVAAPVLVLRPSRGLHHLPAGCRHGFDDRADLRTAAGLRLSATGDGADRDRHPRLRPVGAPHVRHRPAAARRELFHGIQHGDRDPQRRSDLLLAGDAVGRPAGVRDAAAVRPRRSSSPSSSAA